MMCRELLHIWGPFSIYSYGLAIAVALLVFIWLSLRHPWRSAIIGRDKYIETVCLSLVVGLAGARILFIINSFHKFDSLWELFSLWSGGLSMLGGIIAILLFLPWYLKKIKVPLLPLLDLAALYAPLLHAIARLGCFMAGCCYGKPASLPWSIVYTDPQTEAPLNIPLHPTQLYTAGLLLIAFLFFYFIVQKKVHCSGQLLMIYLMVEGMLRFSMDFVRADIEYFSFDSAHLISAHQWIALGMFVISLIGFVVVSKRCQTLPVHQ